MSEYLLYSKVVLIIDIQRFYLSQFIYSIFVGSDCKSFKMKEFIVKFLRPIWHRVMPHSIKSRLIPYINVFFQKRILKKAQQKIYNVGKIKNDMPLKAGPLTVSAFFGEPLGIGRGGHCSFDAFKKAGYGPVAHDLRPILNTHEPFSHYLPGHPNGGVHFIHCNPPEVLAMVRALHPDSYKNNYRIGCWAYELPKAPDDWIEVSHFFHEIWVPSAFVKAALAGAHCPVRVMPHDVLVSIAAIDPQKGKFVKSNDKYVESRSDIHLIAENLNYEDAISLIKSCDLFLSPHRSEGFGLMLAEAIVLEKAVLATGWSGNMEFMSSVPEAHLPFSLIPVDDAANVYAGASDQLWADVDTVKAGKILRATITSQPDFQPALQRIQEISDMWSRLELEKMPFSNWIDMTAKKK